jgi:hypothetical protein
MLTETLLKIAFSVIGQCPLVPTSHWLQGKCKRFNWSQATYHQWHTIFLTFALTPSLFKIQDMYKEEKYSLFRSHPKGLCSSANYLLNKNEASPSVGSELAHLVHNPPPPPPLALSVLRAGAPGDRKGGGVTAGLICPSGISHNHDPSNYDMDLSYLEGSPSSSKETLLQAHRSRSAVSGWQGWWWGRVCPKGEEEWGGGEG